MKDLSPVAGIHSVRALLKPGAEAVVELWLDAHRRDRRVAELVSLAEQSGVRLLAKDRQDLDRAAGGVNHQGVIAWVRLPPARQERELPDILAGISGPPLVLVLDGVQDPHNLGACLRTADAAGVHAVIAPKDNAVGLTPVVCKVASGAAESVPYLQVTNLARTLDRLRDAGLWLVGTAGEATDDLFATDLRGPLGLVMGGEGKGMRRLTRERCDHLVRLPMRGVVESLNVSVATGVCLYEAVRQRG